MHVGDRRHSGLIIRLVVVADFPGSLCGMHASIKVKVATMTHFGTFGTVTPVPIIGFA